MRLEHLVQLLRFQRPGKDGMCHHGNWTLLYKARQHGIENHGSRSTARGDSCPISCRLVPYSWPHLHRRAGGNQDLERGGAWHLSSVAAPATPGVAWWQGEVLVQVQTARSRIRGGRISHIEVTLASVAQPSSCARVLEDCVWRRALGYCDYQAHSCSSKSQIHLAETALLQGRLQCLVSRNGRRRYSLLKANTHHGVELLSANFLRPGKHNYWPFASYPLPALGQHLDRQAFCLQLLVYRTQVSVRMEGDPNTPQIGLTQIHDRLCNEAWETLRFRGFNVKPRTTEVVNANETVGFMN